MWLFQIIVIGNVPNFTQRLLNAPSIYKHSLQSIKENTCSLLVPNLLFCFGSINSSFSTLPINFHFSLFFFVFPLFSLSFHCSSLPMFPRMQFFFRVDFKEELKFSDTNRRPTFIRLFLMSPEGIGHTKGTVSRDSTLL